MNKKICITIGDIEGIGLELLIKLYLKNKIKNFILFTNFKIFNTYLKKNRIKISINLINKNRYNAKKLNIYDFDAKDKINNTVLSIINSYKYCIKNDQKGIITLPVNKKKIVKYQKNFTGHTELFEKLSNSRITNMLFIHKNLIISTLTTHVKIKNLIKQIKKKNYIYDKVSVLNKTLKEDFNIKKPKILVSGLNPHAGEDGILGEEEIKYIYPQIIKLKKNNIKVNGPVSGDAILIEKNLKKYNCFLFIFHDQALIPFKYISKFKGINYTSNLKLIRVSPDHGTAYDLVGKNIAKEDSIKNCFSFIERIYKNKKIDKNK